MKLEKLFARTSTGAIQQWEIEIIGNEIRTTYGQVDGQLVTTDPTHCYGKNTGKANATSDEEQAIKEAKAIFKKKLKEGYTPNIEDIDKVGFFQPQLAKSFEDYEKDITYPLAVEDKLNGVRCVLSKKGAFSRTGEEFHCVEHIKEEFTRIFHHFPDLVFDGELFNPALKNELSKITSLVSVNRKEADVTDEDRENAKKLVQYHIYDIWSPELASKQYKERKGFLANLLQNEYTPDGHGSIIHFVPCKLIYSRQEIDTIMKQVKEEKREGIMLKILDAPYENKRSKNFLKLKVFYDEEFEVVGFIPGTGNWAGKVKKVVCKLNVPATNGKTTFESNIRGSMPELKYLYETQEQHIGKRVTVEYQEKSVYNIPLIPYCDAIFRDYE